MPRDAPVTMQTFPVKEGSSEAMLDESLNQKIAKIMQLVCMLLNKV